MYVQGLGQLVPIPFLIWISNKEFDVRVAHASEEIGIGSFSSVISETKKLWHNPIYFNSVMALTALFFVVFGMQFWGTTYLVKEMEFTPIVAMAIFVSVTITAPLAGVIIGGVISDKMVMLIMT